MAFGKNPMRLALLLFLSFLLGGCATNLPPSELVGLGPRQVEIFADSRGSVTLNEPYTYVFESGGLLGDMVHTLMAGEYVVFGRDSAGTYYRHISRKGLLRSANLGIKEDGGFYMPDLAGGRWGIWLVPNGSAFVIPVMGAIVPIHSSPSKGSIHYAVHIPREDELLLQSKISKNGPNMPAQTNAGSRPSQDDSPAFKTPSAPAPRG